MTAATTMLDRVAPYTLRENVLAVDELDALLAFTLAHEAQFEPTLLVAARLDPRFRTSMALPSAALDPWRARLAAAFTPLLAGLLANLGMPPFAVTRLELELVRHNDGDFYRRHIDTNTAARTTHGRRTLSMVFYFHAEPKAYSGGALRLLSFKPKGAFEDIAAVRNRLVAFPSWAPHEVMSIACPSRRFRDSRFAINCWAWSDLAPAQS